MKFRIPNRFRQNLYVLLRQAGYFPLHDRLSGKNSYARRLSSNRYPRFHLYLQEDSQTITFDLHLDQIPSRFTGQTAHNADYNSSEVKEELIRIYSFFYPQLIDSKK